MIWQLLVKGFYKVTFKPQSLSLSPLSPQLWQMAAHHEAGSVQRFYLLNVEKCWVSVNNIYEESGLDQLYMKSALRKCPL